MTACEAMTVASVASTTSGMAAHDGAIRKNGLATGRVVEDHRALAKVVDREGREDHEIPRQPDGPRPEVAHVRVQRLGASDGQDHPAHRDEGDERVQRDELERVGR